MVRGRRGALAILLGMAVMSGLARVAYADCRPDQGAPYPALPFVGIHGNARNDSTVPCPLLRHQQQVWYALAGLRIAQPVTLSPAADVVYATATPADHGQAMVAALAVNDGHVLWQRTYPNAHQGSVEVDDQGMLYFTSSQGVVSLSPDGQQRWLVPFTPGESALGLHFTPSGDVVTATTLGRVLRIGRDGTVRAVLDLVAYYGLPAPQPQRDNRIGAYMTLVGLSDSFTQNTLAVFGDTVYVAGSGSATPGALYAIHLDDGGGLSPTWWLAMKNTAASPAVSRQGTVALGDGVMVRPEILRVPVNSCPVSGPCTPQHIDTILLGIPGLLGSPAITPNDSIIFWDSEVLPRRGERRLDVVSYDAHDGRHGYSLPFGETVSSPVTVLDDGVVFTMTDPRSGSSQLVLGPRPDQFPGGTPILETHPISGAALVSVAVGPDGSLYVGMMRGGMGVMRFKPVPN